MAQFNCILSLKCQPWIFLLRTSFFESITFDLESITFDTSYLFLSSSCLATSET